VSWIPAATGAIAIFIASAQPGTAYPQLGVPGVDKLVHFTVYGLLGAACAFGLTRSCSVRAARMALAAAAMAAAYGATDEAHQLFVPHRSFDWFDLVADAVGALVGAAVFARFLTRARPATGQTRTRA
jgi:VanZ family protein